MKLAGSLLLIAACVQAAPPPDTGLVVISIDGLNPAYVLNADNYGLRIPNLRRLAREGVYATGVRGVLPTVTYPTHTTMMTGVWPARHGISLNTTFDPERTNMGGWYWYAEDIRRPTLWEAAADAGYAVGSVAWPVSVGAKGVSYLIPEYWRSMTGADDLKLLRAISTPGLLAELEPTLGRYIVDLDVAVPGDWMRTRYAEAMIKRKKVRFLTIHIAALDHIEHETGPGSKAGFAALEEIDSMVAVLENAIRAVAPRAAVCVVSDHGMSAVTHELNLNAAFVQAGLMSFGPERSGGRGPAVLSWKAQPWSAGGSAAIMVKDASDTKTTEQVRQLLASLQADPANGIASVLDRKQIAASGGSSEAAFWVDMKPGYAVGGAASGPIHREVKLRGTHGYAPTAKEMRAAFFLAGPGLAKGVNAGDIDLRSLAPTWAHVLGVPMPGVELPCLPAVCGKR